MIRKKYEKIKYDGISQYWYGRRIKIINILSQFKERKKFDEGSKILKILVIMFMF